MYFEYKDYIKDKESYQEIRNSMEEEIKIFMEHFKDDPRFVSAWGHGYFCNEDGGRLIYDLKKPFDHACSICGVVYKGYQYDSCYITMLRNEAIVTAVKSAFLYAVWEEESYLNTTKEIINFYADHYEHFCIHAKGKLNCDPLEDVGGAGKIMPQGLNEAIIAIRMINALELIKNSVEQEWILQLKEKLFRPIYELLLPQKMHIHNIPTWINSAIGVMGFFYQDEEWISEATIHPFCIFEQLKKGVTNSGFWYEGSIHYNFFALEGIMNFFVFAKVYHYEIPEKMDEIVLGMLKAAYHYAFDNDVFPNPGDGWPDVMLKTYSYVYDMAYKVFGTKVLKYRKHIEENKVERVRMPLSEPYYYHNQIPLEQMLFLPDLEDWNLEAAEKRISKSFEASNCAILRNEFFNIYFKYGHQTTSHAHPDKMGIEIMVKNQVLTKDLSNSGYASKMCNQWHRKIAAHNTCVVNGQASDIESRGKLLEYSKYHVKAEAMAYENTRYMRSLTLKGNSVEDVFQVNNVESRVIDWFFHFETKINTEGLKLKKALGFQEYEYIMDIQEIIVEEPRVLLKNELVQMELELESGMKAYLVKTYNNPSNKLRDTIIIRKEASEAIFINRLTVEGEIDYCKHIK